MAIPILIVGGLLTAAAPPVGIALTVIGVLMAVGAACSGVFNAALYRYATTGDASGAFTEDDLNGSFRPRRRARIGGAPAGFTGQGFGGPPRGRRLRPWGRPSDPTGRAAPRRRRVGHRLLGFRASDHTGKG